MKAKLSILAGILLLQFTAKAQMKIGDNPTNINPASLLELESNNKGFVLPRVSLINVKSTNPFPAIPLPGTMVYNPNPLIAGGQGVGTYIWNGDRWRMLRTQANQNSSSWSLTGNLNTTHPANFIGTLDNFGFAVRTNNIERLVVDSLGNIGIGIDNPTHTLSVAGTDPLYLSGIQLTSNFQLDSVLTIRDGIVTKAPYNALPGGSGGSGWSLTGNTATVPGFNFLGTSDAVDLVLKTDNTERLRVMGSSVGSGRPGYVGIGGLGIPRALLDVTGILPGMNLITIENDAPDGYSSIDMRDNNGQLVGTFGYSNPSAGFLPGTDYFNVYNKDFVITALGPNSSNFFLQGSSTGYIGIGTNAPQQRLHVNGKLYLDSAFMPVGNAGLPGQVLSSQGPNLPPVWTSGGGSGGGWLLTGNTGTNPITDFLGTTDNADMVLRTNSSERLRVLGGSGYIGIGGLAIPRTLLDVTGILPGMNLITIENDAPDGYSSIDMRDNNGQLVGTFGYANTGAGSLAGRDYFNVYNKDFVITALGANANNFFLQGSGTGYIGIGTDAPQQRLHIHGNLQLDSAFMPAGNAGFAGQILYSQGPGLPPVWQDATGGGSGSGWALTGNSGTNPLNQFLGTTDAVDFVVRTNNVERMRVKDVTGNIGIGITNPGSALDVKGEFRLSGSTSGFVGFQPAAAAGSTTYTLPAADGTNGQVLATDGGGILNWITPPGGNGGGNSWGLTGNSGTNSGTDFIGTTDNISLRARTNNIERMVIDSAGKIGIGTGSPTNTLSVLALADPLYLAGVQATSTFTSDSILTISGGVVKKAPYSALPSGGGGSGWLLAGNNGTNSGTDFIGTTDNVSFRARTNNIERMVIDSVGKIGIGITTPAYQLQIEPSSGIEPLYLGSVQAIPTYTTADSILTISNGVVKKFHADLIGGSSSGWNLDGNSGTDPLNQFLGTTDAVDLVVRTNNVERMRVKDVTGNIGIGITNPGSALDVKGALRLSGSASGFVGFQPAAAAGSITYTLPAADGTNGQMLTTDGSGLLNWTTPPGGSGGGSSWGLSGNSGTNSVTDFMGTTDDVSLRVRTNNIERMVIDSVGKIGIGTGAPTNTLSVLALADPLYLAGVQATSTFTSDSILTISAGVVKKAPYSALPSGSGGSGWLMAGNAGTNSVTDFIGTTDDVSFRVRTNNIERMVFDSVGKVGIGTPKPTNKLSVVTLADPLYLAGVQETTTFIDDSLLTIKDGVVKKTPYSSLSATGGWSLSGNDISGVTGSFLGTTSNNALIFKVNNIQAGYLGNSFENRTLFGSGALTSGPYTGTTAIGANAQANNINAVAIGFGSNAAGQSASAIGPQSYAAGLSSIAIGQNTVAQGNNSVAIGSGVTTSADNAFILGNPLTVMVGIGTSAPVADTKLDVNGGFKLGTAGTATKNSESFSSFVNISVPKNGSSEVTFALPNSLSSAQASVAASPSFDLPDGVFIAFARVIAPNALKIRLINTASSNQNVTGNFYCTVTEF